MKYKLSQVCTIKYGKDHRHLEDGIIPVYGSGGIMKYVDTPIYNSKSVLIPRKGTLGNLFFLSEPFWTIDTLFYTEIDETKLIPEYFYYLLKTMDLAGMNVGTAVPSLTTAVLNEIELDIPPLSEQQMVVDALLAFDNKIDENKKINHHLEQMAQVIWSERFGGCEPNGSLGDIIELFDFKRVPLSGNQRDKMEKIYPYYGAATLMDYVDNYLFDGIYLLLGEDGTVIDDSGFPTLQYVWGKFWVNNHAHILQGRNGFTVESLYTLLKQTSVASIVTGAVQPKINQANLKALPVVVPSKEEMREFNDLIDPLFAQIRENIDENLRLTELRDSLLPRLMSGELSVADLGDAK